MPFRSFINFFFFLISMAQYLTYPFDIHLHITGFGKRYNTIRFEYPQGNRPWNLVPRGLEDGASCLRDYIQKIYNY